MASMRVFFKGDGVKQDGSLCKIQLGNARDQVVGNGAHGYYLHFYDHAGQFNIDPEIVGQVTYVTMKETITDPQIVPGLKRGEYRRGSTRSVVIGHRQAHSYIELDDSTEGVVYVNVEISARTPKAAYKMYRDILTGQVQPVRPYGQTSET